MERWCDSHCSVLECKLHEQCSGWGFSPIVELVVQGEVRQIRSARNIELILHPGVIEHIAESERHPAGYSAGGSLPMPPRSPIKAIFFGAC